MGNFDLSKNELANDSHNVLFEGDFGSDCSVSTVSGIVSKEDSGGSEISDRRLVPLLILYYRLTSYRVDHLPSSFSVMSKALSRVF